MGMGGGRERRCILTMHGRIGADSLYWKVYSDIQVRYESAVKMIISLLVTHIYITVTVCYINIIFYLHVYCVIWRSLCVIYRHYDILPTCILCSPTVTHCDAFFYIFFKAAWLCRLADSASTQCVHYFPCISFIFRCAFQVYGFVSKPEGNLEADFVWDTINFSGNSLFLFLFWGSVIFIHYAI